MHQPYKDVINLLLKNAIICIDSFHIIKLLNDCVNHIRMRIIKLYNTSYIEYYLLKKWKFLLFSSNINFNNKPKFNKVLNKYVNYNQLLDLILNIHPDIYNAYYLKREYVLFNSNFINKPVLALDKIHYFYHEFLNSKIPEFYPFYTALNNWDNEIANSFYNYQGIRISNGSAEGINSLISTVIFNSKRIRNSERRKKRTMYVVNKKNTVL